VAAHPDRLDPATVESFVADAHGNLHAVSEALSREPALVNAAWDWGDGDWETALGAAAHMGRREIAELLLEHGARIDIFAAAMLGHVQLVRALTTAVPASLEAKGPHGIPLLAHARAGGAEAQAVVDLLESARAPAALR